MVSRRYYVWWYNVRLKPTDVARRHGDAIAAQRLATAVDRPHLISYAPRNVLQPVGLAGRLVEPITASVDFTTSAEDRKRTGRLTSERNHALLQHLLYLRRLGQPDNWASSQVNCRRALSVADI
jgi:hypothetical protein